MSAPYTVTWGDRAGERGSERCNRFDVALAVYRDKKFLGFHAFVNGDGAELDGHEWHDGLTEDERDQL